MIGLGLAHERATRPDDRGGTAIRHNEGRTRSAPRSFIRRKSPIGVVLASAGPADRPHAPSCRRHPARARRGRTALAGLGLRADRPQREPGLAQGRPQRAGSPQLHRRRQAPERAGVGRGQRDSRDPVQAAGRVPARLLRRLRHVQARRLGVPGTPAPPTTARRCTGSCGLQGTRRLLLGSSGVAADAAELPAGHGASAVWELRLSHWSGDVAQMSAQPNWAYRRYHHLGSLTYLGKPVHGFARRAPARRSTPSAETSTWTPSTRATGKAGGARTASSCTSRPGSSATASTATAAGRLEPDSATGDRDRPGRDPGRSTGRRPGAYDKEFDLQQHAVQKEFFAGDPLCRPV